MAWISENSITIKLQTLSFKENGCGVVDVEITPDEAKDLMKLLNKRYGGTSHIVYPPNVRSNEGCLDKNWLQERYGGDNWEDVMDNKTTGIVEDKNRSTS